MPWDFLLGSAGGAGIVLVFGILLARQLIERAVDSQFQIRIEKLRSELNRGLEFDKSDLAVWVNLRKDILTEMWRAHRDLVKEMTAVILQVQELDRKSRSDLQTAIEEYRKCVHNQIDLISPQAVEICQQFLEAAFAIAEDKTAARDANTLKAIRRKFYEYMAKFYGIEKMMPWMASQSDNPPEG